MSEWTPPSSSDFPRQPTDGIDALLLDVERTKRRLDDATNNLLKAAGISVDPEGMTVASSLNVSGDLNATGSASFGGTLTVTGDAVFSGDLAVPNGSITNDALASPASGGSGNASYGSLGSPASIGTSLADYATATITVPAGFTKAYIMGASSIAAQGASTIQMRTRINGADGLVMNVIADASGWANGSSNYAVSLTGISGSVTITSRCQSGIGGTTGMVTTSALAVFLR